MVVFASSIAACPKYISQECGWRRMIDESDPAFNQLTKKNQYNIKRNNKFQGKSC